MGMPPGGQDFLRQYEEMARARAQQITSMRDAEHYYRKIMGLMGEAEPAPVPLAKSLVAGPVIAYRIWRLYQNASDLFLAAISRADVWPAGMPLNAGKPQPTGGVGAWALRGPEDLKPDAYNRESVAGGRFVCFVTGRVALWGKVIEHEKGYRAEYAYPLTIRAWGNVAPMPGFPGGGLRDTIARVATLYGITAEQTITP